MSARVLRVEYDQMPPSDNHIREIGFVFMGGKRRTIIKYTKEATNYKKDLVRHINDAYFFEVQRFAKDHHPTMVYTLQFNVYFPVEEILNKGWLDVGHDGERKAKSPYKRVDTLNRHKLVQDALAEAIGIDDSLFFEGDGVKLVVERGARIELILEERPPEMFGVPSAYLRGRSGR